MTYFVKPLIIVAALALAGCTDAGRFGSGDTPAAGAGAMLLFGLGTVPALATVTFGLRKIAFKDMRVRRLLAAGVLVAGLWSIGMRQGVLGGGHGMQHGMDEADAPAMEHMGHETAPGP